MLAGGARPHVTLGVCERLNVVACERFLTGFAAAVPAPTVSLASLGLFATDPAVVFLAPVVTAELLALHDRFHQEFRDLAGGPWAYYLPGQWVPHCTVALEVPRSAVGDTVARCLSVRLPIAARLEEVGLVEFEPFGPLHYRFSIRLAEG
jgi:2'-5' RNA ligase